MSLVYVCGPITLGGAELRAEMLTPRIETAELVAAALMRLGHAPVFSHPICRHQAALDSIPQEDAMEVCLEMLRACEAIAYLEGWEASGGCQRERGHAEGYGLPSMDPTGALYRVPVAWTREDALRVLGVGS